MVTTDLRQLLTAQIASPAAFTGPRHPLSLFSTADGTPIRICGPRENGDGGGGLSSRAVPQLLDDPTFARSERSGVPRSTAMAMVGHETESIDHRYAIQDEVMLR